MKKTEISPNDLISKGTFPNTAPIDTKSEIEILSNNDFFELFASKLQKSHLEIPETFVMKDGKFTFWLFFHKEAIKMKKSSKLEIKHLYDRLNKEHHNFDEEMLGTNMSPNKHLNEMLLMNSRPEIAVVRTTSFETIFVNPYELRKLLEERLSDIRLLQNIIVCNVSEEVQKAERSKYLKDPWHYNNPTDHKDPETFYCKYVRNYGFGNYLIYRKNIKNDPKSNEIVYWKTLNPGNENNINSTDYNKGMTFDFLFNLTQLTKNERNLNDFRLQKRYSNSQTYKFFFKSLDNQFNQILQKLTTDLVSYLEHVYGFTIKSVITKFLHDSINHHYYFIGIKRLIIIRKHPFNEILNPETSFIHTDELINFQTNRESLFNTIEKSSVVLERLKPKGTVQVLSKTLLSKMALEVCNGDFCKYDFLSPEKDMLKPQRLEYQGQNTIDHNKRVLGSEFGNKLPFVLLNKTLIDIRNNWERVTEILRKHRIIPPLNSESSLELSLTGNIQDIQYPPGNPKRTWTLKPSDLYRKVKICGRCFQIYSFISSSEFNSDYEVKNLKLSHSEKKFQEKAKEFTKLLTIKPQNPKPKKKFNQFQSLTSRESRLSLEFGSNSTLNKIETDHIFEKLSSKYKQSKIDKVVDSELYLEEKVNLKHFRSQKEQILDSTRLNLGLIFSHETPLSKLNLSSVSKELDKFIMSHKKDKPLQENGRSHHEDKFAIVNFGIHQEDEPSSPGIRRSNINIKKKSTSPYFNTMNNMDLIKKRESLTKNLLINLSKNFDRKKSKLLDFYESRKRILTMTQQRTQTETSSLFHFKSISHLRVLPDYKITIPKLCLHTTREKCRQKLFDISFETLLDILMRKESNENFTNEKLFKLYGVPDLYTKVKIFVYDEFTAIPYVIINSSGKGNINPIQTKGFNNHPRPPHLHKREIVFVVHDFFHNCLEYIIFYQLLINKFMNKTFILFNYPGQAFTIYNQNQLLNNVDIAKIIDSLLFHLNEKGFLSLEYDTIKMVGLGYGGLILSYFLGSSEDSLDLTAGLLINSFSYIDELTFSSLSTCIETFENSPEELPELSYDYYLRLTCTSRPCDLKTLKDKINKNPITTQARIFILKGCFESVNCSAKIQTCKIPLFIIHSLQNSLVRVSQVDIWNKFDEKKDVKIGLKMRTCAYIDGGHDIIEENIKSYEKILMDFMAQGVR